LVALDNYRDQKEMAWASDGFLSDQQDAEAAEWVWQKIMAARDVERIEAKIREENVLHLPPEGQQTFEFNARQESPHETE
jgi:hypothetical protein